MATIAQYIAEINHQRDLLAGHLVARGIIATADEKLNLLVHKVSLLPSGSTEKTVIFDADHRDGIFLSHNNTLYSLSAFTAVYPDFCSSKNEYALNYSTSIFGWDYSCYTCSTVPLTISAATQIAMRFLASSTEAGVLRLVQSDSGTAEDILAKAQTEGSYISDMVEKLALSHPDISFKFINNNQTKLHTSGNGNRKDIIYHIFGREISSSLLEVKHECEYFKVEGFIGKPVITRGNRNYENYFINGRYVKSNILSRAIEEAYKSFLMQHQYPFTVLYFTFFSELDVNVHPTKMELRFDNNNEIYVELCDTIYAILSHKEMIPEVPVDSTPAPKKIVHEYKEPIPEPFEKRRINEVRAAESRSVYGQSVTATVKSSTVKGPAVNEPLTENTLNQQKAKTSASTPVVHTGNSVEPKPETSTAYEPAHVVTGTQQTLGDYDKVFLTESAKKQFSIIGQLFKTYWLIEFEDKLYIIDQHAAHEKVLYEKTMARLANKDFTSQRISPPIVMTLDARESEMLEKYRPQIEQFGYEVEHFGGKEYMISAIPDNLFNIDMKDLFIEMLDDFSNATGRQTPDIITEKVASMSCKAAVKGNDKLTLPEINKLIDELLSLDNPYNCPHGRPTIISMSKYEIEKKFKRIV